MTSAFKDWRRLAERASTEMDPKKLSEIVTELNQALGENEETSRQQRQPSNEQKSFLACA